MTMNTNANIPKVTENNVEKLIRFRGFNISKFSKEIGLSRKSVYRAIRGEAGVSEETRAFVLSEIESRIKEAEPAAA